VNKSAVLNIVGLTRSLIDKDGGAHMPRLKKFRDEGWRADLEEPFPAVTCTSQATMLTGQGPSSHGIVGNGWYFHDLAEVGFWKQNNGLVAGVKVGTRSRSWSRNCPHCHRKSEAPMALGSGPGWATQRLLISRALTRSWPPGEPLPSS
jgi:hypothetical protein